MLPGLVLYCLALGALFTALSGVRVWQVAAGGLTVYVPWLSYLETTTGPFDSPVHVIVGALLLVGFSVGAWLAERSERHGVVGRKRVS